MDKVARFAQEARAALAAAQPGKAVQAVRRAIQLRPMDGDLLCLLAVALLEAGELVHARDAAHRATMAAPGSARVHYHRAVLLRRTGEPRAALEVLAEVLRLQPDHPAAHVEAAHAWADLGQHHPAAAALLEHCSRFADDAQARRDLAVFAEHAGQWDIAYDAWSHVLASSPDDAEAAVRQTAVASELHGHAFAKARSEQLRHERPGLGYALDKALSHAARGTLRLERE